MNSDPSVIVNIPNLKPGDTVTKSFKLKNDGSLDIGSIILNTSTQITDAKGDNYLDLAQFIKVKFLRNNDKGTVVSPEDVVYQTTLADLKSQHPDLVKNTG
ncbi:Camelysin metallo-endopeptidase [compost metagenome]